MLAQAFNTQAVLLSQPSVSPCTEYKDQAKTMDQGTPKYSLDPQEYVRTFQNPLWASPILELPFNILSGVLFGPTDISALSNCALKQLWLIAVWGQRFSWGRNFKSG